MRHFSCSTLPHGRKKRRRSCEFLRIILILFLCLRARKCISHSSISFQEVLFFRANQYGGVFKSKETTLSSCCRLISFLFSEPDFLLPWGIVLYSVSFLILIFNELKSIINISFSFYIVNINLKNPGPFFTLTLFKSNKKICKTMNSVRHQREHHH